MSTIMRPILRRGLLAAGGTVIAAALARKRPLGTARAQAQAQPDHPPFQALDTVRAHPPTPLPPLSFIDGDNRPVTLDGLRGHGLLLNLWATWCVPCVTEMPALDALARTLAPSGIRVLAVSLDHRGADAVRPFFAAHVIRSLPVLLDPHSTSLAALGLDGIPVTLLVNRAGQEVARLQGPVDWATPQAAALVGRLVG